MNKKKKLFVYAKANVMIDHQFSDDVAITYAANKQEAFIKFKQLYDLKISDISEVRFNDYGISILTDY